MAGDRIDPYDLQRSFEVWRNSSVPDGQGGQETTRAQVGDPVRAKVNQPTAAERIEAQRSGVDLTYGIHLLPDAGVRRGDELRGGGEVYRVKATVQPSTSSYLLAQCERDQYES